MKITTTMPVRHVAGEHIIFRPAKGEVDMTQVISFNESSLMLFNALRDREFEVEDVAALLTETYEVDDDTALEDAALWIDSMRHEGLIA